MATSGAWDRQASVRRRGLVAAAVAADAALVLAAMAGAAEGGTPSGSEGRHRDPRLVETDKGVVEGELHDGYRTFEGIPYGAPPVGELRWRAPQPADPWTGVLDATQPRGQCAQLVRLRNPETFEEDCLYLNVTTPLGDDKRARKLPVMVWIHGGALGYGAGANYNASKLGLEGEVVVVTINYRLGTLGFLAHPALSAENPEVGSGNYALEDQQVALRWVQGNIAGFGGDPDRVRRRGERVCQRHVPDRRRSVPPRHRAGLQHVSLDRRSRAPPGTGSRTQRGGGPGKASATRVVTHVDHRPSHNAVPGRPYCCGCACSRGSKLVCAR